MRRDLTVVCGKGEIDPRCGIEPYAARERIKYANSSERVPANEVLEDVADRILAGVEIISARNSDPLVQDVLKCFISYAALLRVGAGYE